jgi:hypothetical protein
MNTYIFFDFDKVITARELYEVRTHRTYECVNERESVSQLGGSHRIHTLNIFFRLIVNQGGILHILSKNNASHIKAVLKHTNLIHFFENNDGERCKSYRIYDRNSLGPYRDSKQYFLKKILANIVNYSRSILIDDQRSNLLKCPTNTYEINGNNGMEEKHMHKIIRIIQEMRVSYLNIHNHRHSQYYL